MIEVTRPCFSFSQLSEPLLEAKRTLIIPTMKVISWAGKAQGKLPKELKILKKNLGVSKHAISWIEFPKKVAKLHKGICTISQVTKKGVKKTALKVVDLVHQFIYILSHLKMSVKLAKSYWSIVLSKAQIHFLGQALGWVGLGASLAGINKKVLGIAKESSKVWNGQLGSNESNVSLLKITSKTAALGEKLFSCVSLILFPSMPILWTMRIVLVLSVSSFCCKVWAHRLSDLSKP